VRGLLSYAGSGVLDDAGDLVLQPVLGGDVLPGVDAQHLRPRFLLPPVLLHLLLRLLLVQVLRVLLQFVMLFEGVSDVFPHAVDDVGLFYQLIVG
jgi:hypothetical protein